MTPSLRHISGTAYIVYGAPSSHSPSQSPQSHYSHCTHDSDMQQPPHCWAVLSSPCSSHSKTTDSTSFVLVGEPLPWGAYPPQMSEPHGCIPPRLYYNATLQEHPNNNKDSHGTSATRTSSQQTQPLWHFPFVHRLGDGQDDAGGLTTAYHLLKDLEDVDDFGAFIADIQNLQQNEKEQKQERQLEEKLKPQIPALYASTQILVAETRILETIDRHIFQPFSVLPQSLLPLKKLYDTILSQQPQPNSHHHSLSLCIADIQLLLPSE